MGRLRRTAPVALVTGASSGIGEAAAILLARNGYRVALVARRGERLRRLARAIRAAGGNAVAIEADLAVESHRQRVLATTRRALGDIDVLVNNAGFGWYGHAERMSWRTARQMLRVHVEATAQLTLLCLRQMRRRGRGHIIFVGSISGALPSQGIALYGATKSFMDGFATALYRELQGTAVSVSIIRPGPVKTEFFDAALRHPRGGRIPSEPLAVDPQRVAAAILSLLRRPRRLIYVPWWLRIVPWVELAFGWAIDLMGPLLLARRRPTDRDRLARRTSERGNLSRP